jgi:hypothetical protein
MSTSYKEGCLKTKLLASFFPPFSPFTGPEPVLGLPYSVVKRAIGDWIERKHIDCWESGKDCKHSKTLMEGPQQGWAIKLLNMSRQQLSVVIGLVTGHLGLNGHLYKTGKDIISLCSRCLRRE